MVCYSDSSFFLIISVAHDHSVRQVLFEWYKGGWHFTHWPSQLCVMSVWSSLHNWRRLQKTHCKQQSRVKKGYFPSALLSSNTGIQKHLSARDFTSTIFMENQKIKLKPLGCRHIDQRLSSPVWDLTYSPHCIWDNMNAKFRMGACDELWLVNDR